MNPSEFRPQCPADFIGPAQVTARLLFAKAARHKQSPDGRLKLLFHGAPGTGKSELARLLAHELTGNALAIDQSELLTYLDGLPSQTAFIATTNLTLRQLPARLQSRFQRFHFNAVSECELADWLAKRFEIPADEACRIACDNRGNIRGALPDAETLLDSLAVEFSQPAITTT